jgi:hypothetical protein
MREDVSLLVPVPAGARKAAHTVAKHARMAHHVTACLSSARMLWVREYENTQGKEK